jgi:DNA-binding transcriptional LysR family regulator
VKFELRQLEYFVILAEELHFGRAAERIAIAQPALSQQIKVLEESLGTELFSRDKRKVKLTQVGQLFLPQARRVLEQAHQAEQVVRHLAEGVTGQLTIALSSLTLYTQLPSLIKTFQQNCPGIDVTVKELCTEEQLVAFKHNQIGVGFLHPPVYAPDLTSKVIYREPFVLALPENHRLADCQDLSLADLANENFIMFSREEGPFLYDRMLGACSDAGFSPKIVQKTAGMHAMLGLVASGIGLAFVVESFQNLKRPGVVFQFVKNLDIYLETALVWSSNSSNPAVNAFLNSID